MVNERVSIQKPFNVKRYFFVVFAIIIAIGIIYLTFLLGAIFGIAQKESSQVYENPIVKLLENYEQQGVLSKEEITKEIMVQAEKEFNSDYINYALFALGVKKLHNPPFSSETPKIRILLGEEIYSSEIIEQKINTLNTDITNPDIEIYSTKKEIISAMFSENMESFMKESVSAGRTEIKLVGSTFSLASKGYLQMYEDITKNN